MRKTFVASDATAKHVAPNIWNKVYLYPRSCAIVQQIMHDGPRSNFFQRLFEVHSNIILWVQCYCPLVCKKPWMKGCWNWNEWNCFGNGKLGISLQVVLVILQYFFRQTRGRHAHSIFVCIWTSRAAQQQFCQFNHAFFMRRQSVCKCA